MGRLHQNGISQKTYHKQFMFRAFGKKSKESEPDSSPYFPVVLFENQYMVVLNTNE